jgi:hypothetical protein
MQVERIQRDLVRKVEFEALGLFTLTLTVPQEAMSHLVGRGKSNITKLKAKYHINIELSDTEEGVACTIQGPEVTCNIVYNMLSQMFAQFTDTATVTLDIPRYMHRFLIGIDGQGVKELVQSLPGTVHINFSKPGSDEDTVSLSGKHAAVDAAVTKLKNNVNALVGNDKFELVEPANAAVCEGIQVKPSDLSNLKPLEYCKKYGVCVWLSADRLLSVCGSQSNQNNVKRCIEAVKVLYLTRHSSSRLPLSITRSICKSICTRMQRISKNSASDR